MTGKLPTVPLGGPMGDPSGHPRWDGEEIRPYECMCAEINTRHCPVHGQDDEEAT